MGTFGQTSAFFDGSRRFLLGLWLMGAWCLNCVRTLRLLRHRSRSGRRGGGSTAAMGAHTPPRRCWRLMARSQARPRRQRKVAACVRVIQPTPVAGGVALAAGASRRGRGFTACKRNDAGLLLVRLVQRLPPRPRENLKLALSETCRGGLGGPRHEPLFLPLSPAYERRSPTLLRVRAVATCRCGAPREGEGWGKGSQGKGEGRGAFSLRASSCSLRADAGRDLATGLGAARCVRTLLLHAA